MACGGPDDADAGRWNALVKQNQTRLTEFSADRSPKACGSDAQIANEFSESSVYGKWAISPYSVAYESPARCNDGTVLPAGI